MLLTVGDLNLRRKTGGSSYKRFQLKLKRELEKLQLDWDLWEKDLHGPTDKWEKVRYGEGWIEHVQQWNRLMSFIQQGCAILIH